MPVLNSATLILLLKHPEAACQFLCQAVRQNLVVRVRNRMKYYLSAHYLVFMKHKSQLDSSIFVRIQAKRFKLSNILALFLKLDIGEAFDSLSIYLMPRGLRLRTRSISSCPLLQQEYSSTKPDLSHSPLTRLAHGDPLYLLLFGHAMDTPVVLFVVGHS
jgi:hypothetical protein